MEFWKTALANFSKTGRFTKKVPAAFFQKEGRNYNKTCWKLFLAMHFDNSSCFDLRRLGFS
jgi:hypothetical protein